MTLASVERMELGCVVPVIPIGPAVVLSVLRRSQPELKKSSTTMMWLECNQSHTGECSCGTDIQTPELLPQNRSTYRDVRSQTWPEKIVRHLEAGSTTEKDCRLHTNVRTWLTIWAWLGKAERKPTIFLIPKPPGKPLRHGGNFPLCFN